MDRLPVAIVDAAGIGRLPFFWRSQTACGMLFLGQQLLLYWLDDGRLPEGERVCLQAIADHPGSSVDREQIGEATDYKRSTRDAYLQRLSARKLIANLGRGQVKLSPHLID